MFHLGEKEERAIEVGGQSCVLTALLACILHVDILVGNMICLFDIILRLTWDLPIYVLYRKVTLLMIGLDNAGKTSTVADLTGGL